MATAKASGCAPEHRILARSELLCITGSAAGKGQHTGHISVVYRSRSERSIGKGPGAEAGYRGRNWEIST